MSTMLGRRGWIAASLAVLTGMALVGLIPQLGFSRTAPAKLWTDEPPKVLNVPGMSASRCASPVRRTGETWRS
jgi:hypothetical protein